MAPLGGAGALSSSPSSRAPPGVSLRAPTTASAVLTPPKATGGGAGAPSSGADTEDDFDEADGEDDDEEDGTTLEAGAGEQMRNETSIKSGYLWKRGEKRKNWKKRWFVLRSSKLCYYKNDKEYQLLRFIDINDVHTVASIELKRIQHSFGIVTSSRQYYVRASSQADKDSWISALNEVKEALRQRSTLTQEIAVDDLVGARRGSALPPAPGVGKSPVLVPAQGPGQQGSVSVVIPGQGQYSAPAQPRAIPGTSAFSPLTTTSASASGSVSEGEQQPPPATAAAGFGLSYASQSSATHSLGSSPGGARATLHAARSPSPHSHSGGELSQGEAAGASRQRSVGRRTVAGGTGRDASAGSSGGEGRGTTTGWTLNTPAGGGGGSAAAAAAYAAGAGALSSSDEEDGEDWDEDEVADQAMPLPGANIPHLSTSAAALATSAPGTAQPTAQPSTPQRANSASTTAEFLKDPNKVINQGYLMKQSSRRKTWRKRWFVLTSSQLMYTRSHMDAKPHRQIPLSSILDALEYTSKKATLTLPSLTGSSGAPAGAQSPMLHSPSAVAGGFSFGSSDVAGSAAAAAERRDGSAGAAAAAGGSGFSSTSDREASATSAAAPAAQSSTATFVAEPSSILPSSATERQLSPSATPSISGNNNLPTSLSALNITSPASSTVVSPNAPPTPGATGGGGGGVAGLGQTKRKKENCFKIITPKRTYVVCAPTEEEEIKWLSALQALLTRTRGTGTTGAGAGASAGVVPSGAVAAQSGGQTQIATSAAQAATTQAQPKLSRAPSTSTNASGEATPTAATPAPPTVEGSSKLTHSTSTPQAAGPQRQRVQSNASLQGTS